jgi:hypothetical protein
VLGLRICFAALMALCSAVFASPAETASAAPGRCVSDNGTNVTAYFGLGRSDSIWLNLQGRHPGCVTVLKGNTFYRTHGWITQLPPGTLVDGERIRTVYPAGYRPAHPAPMADFLSKLVRARYVVSRDGKVELARTVERPELLARARLGRFGDLFVAPDSTLTPGVTIHAAAPEWTTLQPLPSRRLGAGQHTIDIFWTLRDQHCDGFAADPVNDCLPAGESRTTSTVFEVVAPRR